MNIERSFLNACMQAGVLATEERKELYTTVMDILKLHDAEIRNTIQSIPKELTGHLYKTFASVFSDCARKKMPPDIAFSTAFKFLFEQAFLEGFIAGKGVQKKFHDAVIAFNKHEGDEKP